MVKADKYNFSFTGFSLRTNEMTKVAEAINEGLPVEMVDFGDGNRNTGQRRLVEIKKRLNKLTEKKAIIWKWVKAHAGNKFNELADKLATEAIDG